MAKRPSKKMVRRVIDDHAPVEPNLEYWLEHVVHWHALLLAVVGVLTVGQMMFG